MGTHPIFESDFDCLTECFRLQDLFELDYRKLSVVIRVKIFIGLRHQLNRSQKVEEKNQGNLYYVHGFIMKELRICQLMENSITEPLREIISLESLILFTEMLAIIITNKLVLSILK